jgi:hypothetical protein
VGHLLVRRNDTTTKEEQSLSNRLGELEVDEAAHDIVGNWKRFQCFIWFRDDIDDADNWAIIYLSHRDSGLLDQSNASVIRRSLESYTDGDDPDVVMESHSWLRARGACVWLGTCYTDMKMHDSITFQPGETTCGKS